ncbi:hypothetical protein RHSIM_Rhsim09G0065400 [Rhododendron simsii]|uniref:Aminotransferase-like plant mobile domain-containing protein n=1 Tax=Rhododendron simsii TaxID=118357 RepID=A0A834LDU6_RHOSS|nr:hypothetical protein RHSIM_Rhsim09G0065400 [Rhododendron simsii]
MQLLPDAAICLGGWPKSPRTKSQEGCPIEQIHDGHEMPGDSEDLHGHEQCRSPPTAREVQKAAEVDRLIGLHHILVLRRGGSVTIGDSVRRRRDKAFCSSPDLGLADGMGSSELDLQPSMPCSGAGSSASSNSDRARGMACFKSFQEGSMTILNDPTDKVENETTLTIHPAFLGAWALQYEPIVDHDEETDQPTPFSLLGHRTQIKEAVWGNTFKAIVDPSYCKGYWEWLEDKLSRHEQMLKKAKIYEAIYASLFSYDRLGSVMRHFCELWSPSTNTLHIAVGEMSISLWELRALGGLPISSLIYDEAVPLVDELIGVDKDNTPGVFKVAAMMARGTRFYLVVPVQASIYRGLNDIAKSSNPGKCDAIFPVHYVYAWLEEYFSTHFSSGSQPLPQKPKMIRYVGEREAKQLDEAEALDLF